MYVEVMCVHYIQVMGSYTTRIDFTDLCNTTKQHQGSNNCLPCGRILMCSSVYMTKEEIAF